MISCKTPELPAGTYDVKVVNADGTTATLAGAFKANTVVPPTCTVTSLNIPNISENVRTNILINGTEFNGTYKTLKVYIGSYAATVVSVISPAQIKVRTAAMPAGVYDVKVINADGTTAVLAGGLTVS